MIPAYEAVIFDLDGTLLDTLADIAGSMNQILADSGFPTFELDTYKTLIGDGIDNLVRRTLPESQLTPENIAIYTNRIKQVYSSRWKQETRPYPDIDQMILGVAGRLRMAVLSNKPHELTNLCVSYFFPEFDFERVYGLSEDIPRKPDPTGVQRILREMDLKPEQVIYMGDTDTDMKTAVAANLFAIGVTWGFRSRDELLANGASLVIDSPLEWLLILGPD